MPNIIPSNRPTVHLHTDGSTLNNPGHGGWAAILNVPGTTHEKEITGLHASTTNNRMEMTAALEGLRALKTPSYVTVFSDAEYVVFNMRDRIQKWVTNGWKTGQGKAVLNQDLWMAILQACKGHHVTWTHVKGHAGNPLNERADKLAKAQAQLAKEQFPGTQAATPDALPWDGDPVQQAAPVITAYSRQQPDAPLTYDYSPEEEALAMAEECRLEGEIFANRDLTAPARF